jgi:hypothetical protein
VRKNDGDKARLCFGAHAVMENRNGLCVLFQVRNAVGQPESAVAVDGMIELRNRGFAPRSVGADRGYHTETFIEELREEKIEPHPALMDRRHPRGVKRNRRWTASQKARKRIRGDLRVDEDHRQLPQKPLPRHRTHPCRGPIRRRRVQSDPHGQTDDDCAPKTGRDVMPREAMLCSCPTIRPHQ